MENGKGDHEKNSNLNIIKLGLISILVFGLIITAFSLLFPSRIRVSKAIDISTDREQLISKLADARAWREWYPGADTLELLVENGQARGLMLKDQKAYIRITHRDDSTILAITEGQGIRAMRTGWNILPAASPNHFTVQWYMDFHLRWYPWEKFSGILLEKRYGPVMEQGLDKLKGILENNRD